MESKIKNQQHQSFLPLFPFSLFTIFRKVKSLLTIHHMTTLKSVLVSSLSCSFLQRLLFISQVLGEACIIFSFVSNSGVFYGYLLYVIYFNDLLCPLEILDLFFCKRRKRFHHVQGTKMCKRKRCEYHQEKCSPFKLSRSQNGWNLLVIKWKLIFFQISHSSPANSFSLGDCNLKHDYSCPRTKEKKFTVAVFRTRNEEKKVFCSLCVGMQICAAVELNHMVGKRESQPPFSRSTLPFLKFPLFQKSKMFPPFTGLSGKQKYRMTLLTDCI